MYTVFNYMYHGKVPQAITDHEYSLEGILTGIMGAAYSRGLTKAQASQEAAEELEYAWGLTAGDAASAVKCWHEAYIYDLMEVMV